MGSKTRDYADDYGDDDDYEDDLEDYDTDEDDEVSEEDGEEEDGDTVTCPYCKSDIYEDAVQCPRCGAYLSAEDAPRPRKPWWIVIGFAACFYAIYRWLW